MQPLSQPLHTHARPPTHPPPHHRPQTSNSVVEFEDLSLAGQMPPAMFGKDRGQAAVRRLLRLSPLVQLEAMPANFTLRGAQGEGRGA